MFLFVFFIVVALSQYITNKILNISDDNTVGYTYSKRDSLIILLFLMIAIGLQFLKFKGKILLILLGIYAFSTLLTMVILATIKRVIIQKQREELQQVFDVLAPVLPKNTELDFNNPPFKLGYEKHQINRITIDINPNTFKESVAVNLCLSLNKYLPNYEWMNEFDFASRECIFVGTPLPPQVARYQGSWLRPAEFIPIGLSGMGEVSWTINSYKDSGRALYVYDDGRKAQTVDSPSAPQALCVGGPLSLNTIIPTTKGYKTMGTIEVNDEVFDFYNKPVKVLAKSEINNNPDKVYKLVFSKNNNTLTIISDSIHRFPKIVDDRFYMSTVEELNINDKILDSCNYTDTNYIAWTLTKKELINKEPVQCILVDSNEHLFLITDEINENWKGGQSYLYKAIYTRNTGGGKSIYINQEVEVQND